MIDYTEIESEGYIHIYQIAFSVTRLGEFLKLFRARS